MVEFAQPLDVAHGYLSFEAGEFKMLGRSIAGIETVLTLPFWDLTLDTGRSPDFAFQQNTLALTHWHLDHSGGLTAYLGLRHIHNLKPLTLLVPDATLKASQAFLESLVELAHSQLRYHIQPASTPYHLKGNLVLQASPNRHAVPSTAYSITRETKKLKAPYRHLSSQQIATAKERGESITELVSTPLFAFSGDSGAEFLTTDATHSRYLVAECSFLDDRVDYDNIRSHGHMHIRDWQAHAENIRADLVVMTHISKRYSHQDIEQALTTFLPKSLLDRLVVWR